MNRCGSFVPSLRGGSVALSLVLVLAGVTGTTRGAEAEWVNLSSLADWKGGKAPWETVADVTLRAGKPTQLAAQVGTGVFYNGPAGRAPNLISNATFGDVEVHLEFNVPKGSNSGIKLQEVYEIQIFDSHDAKTLTASHCGGVYPRAELLPRYHHIDKGYPPKVNACKPAGEWQTLDIVFRAPRFDAAGKKTANAAFVSVKLNGQIVQENLEVPYPTGNNWRNKEVPSGALLLQGDHGAVAFRNVRARALK